MTKGRPFSIYCIILFLDAEARKDNHILLQRGMYLSQKWRQISLLAFQKPSDGYPHKVCDIIGCNHNRITKPTKTQIRTHLQKVCVRIFQYGAKLATGPREANASACTTHEPAPKGMVQPPFRPIRLWRDLRSKMVHCTVFARRYARRRGPTGCGARIVRRPLGGPSPLRPRPRLRLPVSAAGGGRLRGCSRPR